MATIGCRAPRTSPGSSRRWPRSLDGGRVDPLPWSYDSEEVVFSDRERKYGFSFSWRRAIGLSALKGRISRAIGIPLTREGRQRKVGAMLGCCVPLAFVIGAPLLLVEIARHLG